MVPKQLRKAGESLVGDKDGLVASFIELQRQIENDQSILRQPIDTGVRGVRDLIKAVVGGTQELQELLLNECTVIYECKLCKNLFRSLANFISHKRIYCIQNFTYFTEAKTKQQKEFFAQSSEENSDTKNFKNNFNLGTLNVYSNSKNIVPHVKTEKNNCVKPTRRIKISPIKISRKCDIAKIADKLSQKARRESSQISKSVPGESVYSDNDEKSGATHNVQEQLSSIGNNSAVDSPSGLNAAVSNESVNCNSLNSMQIEAIDRVLPYNEAILQENGKFRVTPQGMQLEDNENLENYKCSVCDTHFITKQILSRHVQVHHKERICYPCPLCGTFFPSPSSTYKHLSKDHHKTEQQIRRLRPKVLSKARKRKLIDENRKIEEKTSNKFNKLTNNVGILSCSNCGKLFNRQAVLRVHLPSCKVRSNEKEQPSENASSNRTSSKQNNKKIVPPTINSIITNKSPEQKCGILVRRDYIKNTKYTDKAAVAATAASSAKNRVVENSKCEVQSLNRLNKWRTVLLKLQKKNGLNISDNNFKVQSD